MPQTYAPDRRRSGNVAVITAVSILPLVGLAGLGMDMARVFAAEREMQEAIDAAVLAAARQQASGETNAAVLRATAEQMFAAHAESFDPAECAPMTVTTDAEDGRVALGVSCAIDTVFPAIAGLGAFDVGVAGEARYERTSLDLALMLDVTGSMSGQKLADLKTAAKELVDILTAPSAVDTEVRIALAPFATTLNAGPYAAAVTGVAGHPNTCVTERTGAQAYTGAAPAVGAYHVPATAWCPGPDLTPLSDDPVALKADIDAMTAGGMTAGHLGVSFARYLIAPEWAGVWPAASEPLAFGPGVVKILVLMTDGMFNMQYSGLGSSATQAANHCNAIKAQGYTIYSVAYQAPPPAQALLQACASDPGKYFATSTGSALIAAYQQIATDLLRLRVSE